ncbi:MAG: vWA domain-containing protein [Anaerolineales bacterium]
MDRRSKQMIHLLLTVLVLVLASGFTGSFQTTDDPEDAEIRITQVDTSNFPQVTVYVTVVDQNGEPVGVDPARIQLVENGVVIPSDQIAGMGEVQSLTALLAIDVSGSMWADGKLEAAKAAALKFVDQLRPEDQVGLVTFSETVEYVLPLTTDRELVAAAINGLEAEGDTAMYDALEMAVKILEPLPGRKAVLALTDGLDNQSEFTPEDVLAQIGPSGLSISTVGLGNPEHGPGSISALDEDALMYLAENAGGVYGTASDGESLTRLYESYAVALKSEYVLTYFSPADLRDGVNRALTVSLAAPGSSAAAVMEGEQVVYNPGGLLPEVSEPAPWPMFAALLGVLGIALLLPGLFRLVFKPKGSKKPRPAARKQSMIKLKD